MNFEGDAAERRFRRHFHSRRVVQDQCFAVTQVRRVAGGSAVPANSRSRVRVRLPLDALWRGP